MNEKKIALEWWKEYDKRRKQEITHSLPFAPVALFMVASGFIKGLFKKK